MSNIKLKDLLKENFSGALVGGIVSRNPFYDNISLSKIVKEKYGEVEEQEVDVKGLTTEISSYNKLSEAIFGKSNITQIAEKLSWIANQAKSHTLQETEDWFDKITVNRNMKELTGLSGQFGKIANEAKSLQERMGALYEDMGNILNRYYDIEDVREALDPVGKEDDDVDNENGINWEEVLVGDEIGDKLNPNLIIPSIQSTNSLYFIKYDIYDMDYDILLPQREYHLIVTLE